MTRIVTTHYRYKRQPRKRAGMVGVVNRYRPDRREPHRSLPLFQRLRREGPRSCRAADASSYSSPPPRSTDSSSRFLITDSRHRDAGEHRLQHAAVRVLSDGMIDDAQ
jgi:hypothetical protein